MPLDAASDPMTAPTSIQTAFARALLDPAAAMPAGIVDPEGRAAPRRFGVYRNNVSASLTEALVETYPGLVGLVGPDFFRAMARVAVVAFPPHSPVLLEWGGDLACFIEGFPPAAELPYLADVARLEWARVEAFHAADAVPIDPARFGDVPADRVGDLVLTLHPSVRIVASRFAILSILVATLDPEALDAAGVDLDAGETVLITRPDWAVDSVAVPASLAGFVAALAVGRTLGEAASEASTLDATFDLADALSILIRAGAVAGLSLDGAPVA
jgi:hypothetical protein